MCNWDVSRAQAVAARRRLHETTSVRSPGADPLAGRSSAPASGEEAPDTRTEQMEPCFNDHSVQAHSSAPGSHVSTFQDEDAPGIASGMLFLFSILIQPKKILPTWDPE